MEYINTKTGAVIDSSCIISGGDWTEKTATQNSEAIVDPQLKNNLEDPDEIEDTDKIDDEIDLSKLNIADLRELLDERGIKYNLKATKNELISLLV